MTRMIIRAARAARPASDATMLRSIVVFGCALALILAEFPLSF